MNGIMINLYNSFICNLRGWLFDSLVLLVLISGGCLPLFAQNLVPDADAESARIQCMNELHPDCLVDLILSISAEGYFGHPTEHDGANGNLYILMNLGYNERAKALAATVQETPASLLLKGEFEAAATLLEKNSQNILYEQWSARDQAILMVAKEYLRRGDIESAIETALESDGFWGDPDSYLTSLLHHLLRQNRLAEAIQIMNAMSNRNPFSFNEESSGPRDRGVMKLVEYLLDHGRLDEARNLADEIIGLPEKCDAAIRIAHAYYAVGNVSIAKNTLNLAAEALPHPERRSQLVVDCAISLSGRQLEFGEAEQAQLTADIADAALNLELPRNVPGPVADIWIVLLSKLAVLQKRLGNVEDAERSFGLATRLFENIDKPHKDFPAEPWLIYASAIVMSDENQPADLDPLVLFVSANYSHSRSGDGPVSKFIKEIAADGDWETARLLSEQVAEIGEEVFDVYNIQDAILAQMALRGNVGLAQDLVENSELPFERYQLEQRQRWVAQAAFVSGNIDLARQILWDQMRSNPAEPRQVIAQQRLLGLDEDLRESFQIYFEQVLQLPADRRRNELFFIAFEILK